MRLPSRIPPATLQPDSLDIDIELLKRVRAGDSQAAGQLVLRHRPTIFRAALKLPNNNPNDAEDLTQDAIVRALEYIDGFRGDANAFAPWLRRIAVNLWSDSFKGTKGKHAKHSSLDQLLDSFEEGEGSAAGVRAISTGSVGNPAHIVEADFRLRAATKKLESLPEKYRTVLTLFYRDSYSYEEIAALLDLSMGTVKSRHARGREALQRALASWED